MENKFCRRENESLADYKERLYKNRSTYGLSWDELGDILDKQQNSDHIRKTSYGYLERIADEKLLKKMDKNVMLINDLHVPFQREDVLEVISKHADEIDTLVIGGDYMDCESISSFPKITRQSLVDELISAYEFMKKIRKILNKGQKIVLLNGNHEERLKMIISKLHEKDLQKFINPNILDMFVEGFTIYDEGKKLKYDGIEGITYVPHWYVNIDNKIIVAHPKDFSSVDGKMCEKTVEHFLNKHEDFEVVVFAHTHKYTQMKVSRRQGVYVVENGCMCQNHQYADCGKLGYTPQDYCYTIIRYNEDEKINYNNISVYHLNELDNKQQNYKVFI